MPGMSQRSAGARPRPSPRAAGARAAGAGARARRRGRNPSYFLCAPRYATGSPPSKRAWPGHQLTAICPGRAVQLRIPASRPLIPGHETGLSSSLRPVPLCQPEPVPGPHGKAGRT